MWYYIQAVRTNGFPPQMSAGLREQNMRGWRNWQTRTFEVRVATPYGFKSRHSHQLISQFNMREWWNWQTR